jgi:glutamyl-tRNA reductase
VPDSQTEPNHAKPGRLGHAGSSSVFPVAVLTEGRPCLVVGGGKIATRKAKLLLDADAAVTVVAPEISEELAALGHAGKLRLVPRRFVPADLDGMAVVFAATDDTRVNREVLDLCREKPTLACAIDCNWGDGDFITPATIRADGTLVSVSTGGKSCRLSRLIKDNLTRYIDVIRSADLLVLGTSHRYLTVNEREPYHLACERLEAVGKMLTHVWGIHEFVLLNTCNRVELLAVAAAETIDSGILVKLMGFDRLEPGQMYLKRGYEAFQHSAFVIAGLLSQSPGEKHIVAQVNEALALATRNGWAGSILTEWLSSALHAAKRIRQLPGHSDAPAEIEDLCLAYLAAGRPAAERRVLVLGAGDIGKGLVANLPDDIGQCLWCYRTRKPRVPARLADKTELVPLADLPAALTKVNTVLCAAGGSETIITPELSRQLRDGTEIIDLAMPRNADPAVVDAARAIEVIDLDGIKQWFRQENVEFVALLHEAETVVREHESNYDKLIGSLQNRDAVQ